MGVGNLCIHGRREKVGTTEFVRRLKLINPLSPSEDLKCCSLKAILCVRMIQ